MFVHNFTRVSPCVGIAMVGAGTIYYNAQSHLDQAIQSGDNVQAASAAAFLASGLAQQAGRDSDDSSSSDGSVSNSDDDAEQIAAPLSEQGAER